MFMEPRHITFGLPSRAAWRSSPYGAFHGAPSIGNNIHLLTSSTLQFPAIDVSIDRSNPAFEGMSNIQYTKAAAKIAEPLIADVVTVLKNAIPDDGKVPKNALWQTDVRDSGNLIERLHGPGFLKSDVQITSFSVHQDLTGALILSKAGTIVPYGLEYTWAVDGNPLLAVKGWNWNPWWRGSSKRTYVLGFKLKGTSASPFYLGSVDGRILADNYRPLILSVYQGHVRVAATEDEFWPVWKPVLDADGYTLVPEPVSTINTSVHVLKIPTGNETIMTEVTSIVTIWVSPTPPPTIFLVKHICYTLVCILAPASSPRDVTALVVFSSSEQL